MFCCDIDIARLGGGGGGGVVVGIHGGDVEVLNVDIKWW